MIVREMRADVVGAKEGIRESGRAGIGMDITTEC